jgi:ESCRT-II complex subunit
LRRLLICLASKQEHQETWAKQRALWIDLILRYCAHHRIFRLSLEETTTETSPTVGIVSGSTLFHNKSINRKLDPVVQREILDHMVKKGQAAWRREPPASSSKSPFCVCYIYWKSLNEWSEIIYHWVSCLFASLRVSRTSLGRDFLCPWDPVNCLRGDARRRDCGRIVPQHGHGGLRSGACQSPVEGEGGAFS